MPRLRGDVPGRVEKGGRFNFFKVVSVFCLWLVAVGRRLGRLWRWCKEQNWGADWFLWRAGSCGFRGGRSRARPGVCLDAAVPGSRVVPVAVLRVPGGSVDVQCFVSIVGSWLLKGLLIRFGRSPLFVCGWSLWVFGLDGCRRVGVS